MSPVALRAVRVHACAKINLTLRVLGIRDDGYHELRTTFQSLALHDTLTFRARPGPFVLEADDPQCPIDSGNLVWKAADRLWRAAGRAGRLSGVSVRLAKRIPSEAGLGGGSSDAAATLVALRTLWRTDLTDEDIDAVARDLGADVPFFVRGGTVLGVERGDVLFPLPDVRRAWVVLARPDFGVSTAEAYRWWDQAQARSSNRRSPRVRPARAPGPTGIPRPEWINDLEAPVIERHPRIARLAAALRRAGAAYAAMSGSGSAVFALFDDRPTAAIAAEQVATPSVRVWVTRTLTRAEFARRSAPTRAS